MKRTSWKSRAAVMAVLAVATLSAHAQNVIAWGNNNYGQTSVPVSASNVVSVAAGYDHSLALRSDGTVVAWGLGTSGQTNIPASATNLIAIAAGANHSLGLRDDGMVIAWGDNGFGQTNVPDLATGVVAIAAGYFHNLALRGDGTVIAWGKNANGQTDVPPELNGVVAISAGAEHSMALLEDGSLVAWGNATASPYFDARIVPGYVTNKFDLMMVAAGATHNVAVRADRRVVVWGTNTAIAAWQVAAPANVTNVVAIAAGTNYTLALRGDGSVVGWGVGVVTNVPSSATNVIGIAAGLAHGLAVRGDGSPRIFSRVAYRKTAAAGDALPLSVLAVGKDKLNYQWFADGVPLAGATNFNSVIPARVGADNVLYHVIVSNALGSAMAGPARFTIRPINVWGDNTDGQRRFPVVATNAVAFSAGAFHSVAVDENGSLVAWGKNVDGQVNVPEAASNVVAVAAGGDHTVALRDDGSVIAWGRNWDGQTDVPPQATNVIAVAAGWAHSLALRADGTVVAWGDNTYGQTAVSFLANEVVAIAAGYYHNLALRADGRVVGWGGLYTVPSSATNVMAIAAGWQHSLALRADGSVLAWGDNAYGQTNVPASATNVIAIAAGWYHSIALRADGTVVAWGKNNFSMTNTPVNFRDMGAISAGEDHSIALAVAGPPRVGRQVASVVVNKGGQLILRPGVIGSAPMSFQWYQNGLPIPGATNSYLFLADVDAAAAGTYVLVATNVYGQTTNRPVTVTVEPNPVTVTAVGAWGENFLGQCDIPPGLSEPCAIAAGSFHSLALQADGKVVAWGKNADGQTNVPPSATNIVAVAAGGDHNLALRLDGSVLAWGSNSDGQTNVPPEATNVTAIAAGWAHSLALTRDGNVLAWGGNQYRQTNVPPMATNIIRIAAGYFHNLALRSDRTVVAWGTRAAVPASVTNVVDIAAGWEHSLALRADGTVVAWGDNSYGQTNVPASATNVVAVAAGYGHSWALRADGTLLGWGTGRYGVTNVPAGTRNVAAIAAGENHVLALVESGLPRFRRQEGVSVAHVGGRAWFTADLAGSAPVSCQWYRDGEAIDGATGRVLVLENVQPGDAGVYALVASNRVGQTSNTIATLTVSDAPAVEAVPAHIAVAPGAPFRLSATACGSPPVFLQWQLNGTAVAGGGRISGANSTTLSNSAAGYEDAGSYSLVVSNEHGVVTGLVAVVAVTPIVAWGDNAAGQITVPVAASNVVSVAAGGDHNLALLANGRVVAWGDDTYGQNNVPESAVNVVAIADGESHSLALRADGTVVAWGDNTWGQTNVPVGLANVTAIAAGSMHSLALRGDGRVIAWGSGSATNVPTMASASVVAIAAGEDHSLALSNNGTVFWSFPYATGAVAISAGACQGLALRADGSVLAWGRNDLTPTNVPAAGANVVAIASGGDHSLALRNDGSVVAWGGNYRAQCDVPVSAANAVAISAGGAHSLALLGNGRPNLLIESYPRAVTLGEPTTFIAFTTGGSPASYHWQFNGMDIPGANKPSFALASVHWTNAGVYRVIISNAFGVVTGPPMILSVLRTPLWFDPTTLSLEPTNGELRGRLLGASGVGPVVVWASSDLQTWQPIFTNPPVIGSLEFSDPEAGNRPHTFYRASEGNLPQPIRLELLPPQARATGRVFPIRVTGVSAFGPITIYASSNLVDWEGVFTNPPTVGPLEYWDAPPGAPEQRFYRASEAR